jgi:hypothetical protein
MRAALRRNGASSVLFFKMVPYFRDDSFKEPTSFHPVNWHRVKLPWGYFQELGGLIIGEGLKQVL